MASFVVSQRLCQPIATQRSTGGQRKGRAGRLQAVCAARQEEGPGFWQQAAGLALCAGCAASLALSALPAHAVSGGGGAGTPLRYQDFTGQDLSGKKYYKADMRGSDFSGAKLQGTNLFGALLADAKFVGADLTGADLESAVLDNADLSNAVLVGAQMTNAQLIGTKIEGADFSDIYFRKDIQAALCKKASGTNTITGVSTRDSLFCPN